MDLSYKTTQAKVDDYFQRRTEQEILVRELFQQVVETCSTQFGVPQANLTFFRPDREDLDEPTLNNGSLHQAIHRGGDNVWSVKIEIKIGAKRGYISVWVHPEIRFASDSIEVKIRETSSKRILENTAEGRRKVTTAVAEDILRFVESTISEAGYSRDGKKPIGFHASREA